MSTVYVLNKDGKPLMPTTRGGHVRHLLKEQKARVVRAKPFTIQLLYESNDVVQPLYLGIVLPKNYKHGNEYESKIMEDLGFSNRTQFYRLFRKNYGMTPREYRKSKFR